MFKADFKYYKSKKPPPCLAEVLNLSLYRNVNKVKQVKVTNVESSFFGLKPIIEWKIFEFVDHPGFLFISNPFTNLGQRYWMVRSLKDYSRSPNITNLDIHDILPKSESWWNYCQRYSNVNILNRLRWATLGYHHNWDTKVYTDDQKTTFPEDLTLLCSFFARILKYDDFKPEAAIVNYYHMDSTLSGHTDHSERNLKAPLFSFSFGQKAIFLLGGETVDIKPTAMYLQSGDVVVMSKESRLSYHGVPKILSSDNQMWNTFCEKIDENMYLDDNCLKISNNETLWKPFSDYLGYSRININVRQVLYESQLKLN